MLKILTFLAAAEMSNCHFCTEITIENKSVVKIMETCKFDLVFAQTKLLMVGLGKKKLSVR